MQFCKNLEQKPRIESLKNSEFVNALCLNGLFECPFFFSSYSYIKRSKDLPGCVFTIARDRKKKNQGNSFRRYASRTQVRLLNTLSKFYFSSRSFISQIPQSVHYGIIPKKEQSFFFRLKPQFENNEAQKTYQPLQLLYNYL